VGEISKLQEYISTLDYPLDVRLNYPCRPRPALHIQFLATGRRGAMLKWLLRLGLKDLVVELLFSFWPVLCERYVMFDVTRWW
jgi:hypothetical protein